MNYHYVVNTSFKIASSDASTTMDGTHFLAYFEYRVFQKKLMITSNLKNRFLNFSILILKNANSNMWDPVKERKK